MRDFFVKGIVSINIKDTTLHITCTDIRIVDMLKERYKNVIILS